MTARPGPSVSGLIDDNADDLKESWLSWRTGAGLWRGFAIRDGNLITGQQNFSGTETAEVIVAALGE